MVVDGVNNNYLVSATDSSFAFDDSSSVVNRLRVVVDSLPANYFSSISLDLDSGDSSAFCRYETSRDYVSSSSDLDTFNDEF